MGEGRVWERRLNGRRIEVRPERRRGVSGLEVITEVIPVKSLDGRPGFLVRVKSPIRVVYNRPVFLLGLVSPADLTRLLKRLVVSTPEAGVDSWQSQLFFDALGARRPNIVPLGLCHRDAVEADPSPSDRRQDSITHIA